MPSLLHSNGQVKPPLAKLRDVHMGPSQIPDRIVAEVSKNWFQDEKDSPGNYGRLLCKQFEQVIDVNRNRGYALESWQLATAVTPATPKQGTAINETIIAVFVKVI